MLTFLNWVIRWSFYLLFISVPLIFTSNTSELFELNKMWVTWGLTLIIAASWVGKWVVQKQVKIYRTPLDLFVLLFLVSQIVSTIFSLDVHISIWGYYSRFNGGLLSLLSYGFLYFAFVSYVGEISSEGGVARLGDPRNSQQGMKMTDANLGGKERQDPRRFLNNAAVNFLLKCFYIIIGTGAVVALWGLPSHFGFDPTCLLFRGSLDVSCWTNAFQPKVRIFSTLGQPDWLAAYLVYLIPLSTTFSLLFAKVKNKNLTTLFMVLTALFYIDLLYTKARSGFVGFGVAFALFTLVYLLFEWKSFVHKKILVALKKHWVFLSCVGIFVFSTFLIGAPVSPLDRISLDSVVAKFTTIPSLPIAPSKVTPQANPITGELGGTDSGKIRLFVWQGAWEIFLHNPFFGTGVETFAYAYYQYRPAGHNLTSEWDYLYNKAHNEYLNYLATTGAVGLGTYLLMIGGFLFIVTRYLMIESRRKKEDNALNSQSSTFNGLSSILSDLSSNRLLVLALLSSYISILVTNFFGFSVVIMNIFLFLTPAFVWILTDTLSDEKVLLFPRKTTSKVSIGEFQWIVLAGITLCLGYFLIVLIRFWMADTSYAYGFNLDRANEYQAAYSYLHDAVATRPSEPTFRDELTIDDSVLSVAFAQQKDSTNAAKLAQEAVATSNDLVAEHPNNISFWKTRVRVMYTLSQLNPGYLVYSLDAIQKASALAPTDAKVWYNYGLLLAQNGKQKEAVNALEKTTQLKPDYRDAWYALGIYSHQAALKDGKVVDNALEQKAVDTMHHILDVFGPSTDLKIEDTLKSWGEQ